MLALPLLAPPALRAAAPAAHRPIPAPGALPRATTRPVVSLSGPRGGEPALPRTLDAPAWGSLWLTITALSHALACPAHRAA